MRHNTISLKILVSLMLTLIAITNWTIILAQPFTTGSSSETNTYNPTQPVAATPASASSEIKGRAAEAYAKLPISFEANRGQTDSRVKFFSHGSNHSLFLTSNESVLVLNEPVSKKASTRSAAKRRRAVLRMKLEGAKASAQVEGIDELPGKTNYFMGKDAGQWRTDVPGYARVQYRDIYPGVDMVYYENGKGIEYDFVVAAGADYKKIRLAIGGAKKARIDGSGDLVLTTTVGEIRQLKPFVYQEVDGTRRGIKARYTLDEKQKVGFEIGEYDTRLPLVIDPVLDYSTFLGGTNTDEGRAIVIDSSGNAYITGNTASFNFPTTKDAFDTTYADSFDVFVTKLNAAGSAIIYSTYMGGNSQDQGMGIFVDSTGAAYITGFTNSIEFPVTAGVVQPMLNGTFDGDAFVTKLNSAGTALVYSTFLGGSVGEQGAGIAVDASGNAYVTGLTESTNFPTTMGAFQTTNAGGIFSNDAFVTKLNPTATALVYSTYLGGTSEDQGVGISVDSTGRAFVAGSTNSNNFDVTAGAFQTTFGGSSGSFNLIGDAFVTEFNSTGTALVYSTYLGGTGNDGAFGLAVNASGEAFICGSTTSFNLPVTPGVVRILNGGIAKSTNSANTWGAVNNGLTDGHILSFAIDPTTPAIVYTGTNQGGIFKSTNGGSTWSPSNSGLTSLTIKAIAINPTTPSTLYLGTNGRGVFKSTDSGSTWKAINTGQGGSIVNALVLDPSNPATIYAGTDAGVFKTINSGANWTAVNTGLNSTFIQSLAIDPVNTSNLYAGTFNGIFFTRNGGQNWSPSNLTNAVIRALRVDPLTPANVYGGGDAGSFKSTDAGVTWQSNNVGLTNRIVNALAINPANPLIVYAGTGNGVFKSTDGGNTWASVSTGLAGSEISALAIDPLTPATLYTGSIPGNTDGFVARLISSGAGLTYCTYLGGDEFDTSNSIAVDSAKNAYVIGTTNSRNFPTTPGTFQSLSGFNSDAYVTKLNATGNGFGYSTYLGGNSSEQGLGIAVNSSGNAYVTGSTTSTDFPTTPGAFQTIFGGFSTDGFVAKLAQTPSLLSDLRIDLTGPPGTLTPGSFIQYSITVTNDGPDPAFAITVTDELSPFTTFFSCNSSFGCTTSGNTAIFSISKLEPFATFTANVSTTVNCSMPDGSTITNTAKVESPTPDPVPSNNMDSVSNSGSSPPPMLSSTSQAFTMAGGNGSVSVTTNSSCPWTAVSNASWIHITFSSNCCNGFVNFTVDANPGPPRIGTMTIAGITFTVQQSGVTTSETIGVYDPPTRTFYLRNSNTPGNADIQIQYGPASAVPVVGDWNGDGVDTIGVYEPSTRTFYLRNSNTVGNADLTIQFGPAGALPIVGDWNGDGTDTIGVYDPATRTFYLRNSNTPGNADIQIQYGPASVLPVAGAWAALGIDTIGVYEPSTRTFYLRNSNTPGPADIQVQYGPNGSVPTVGDFDNNGSTTIGVYETGTRTFYLRNINGPGNADIQIQYGPAGATPLIGDWDGQ